MNNKQEMSGPRPSIDYVELCEAIEKGDKVTAQNLLMNNCDVNDPNKSDLDHLHSILCEISTACNIFSSGIFTILRDNNVLNEKDKTTVQNLMLNNDDDHHDSVNDNSNGSIDDSVDDNDNDHDNGSADDSNARDHCDWVVLLSTALNIIEDLLNYEAKVRAIYYNTSRILNVAIEKNNTLGACLLIQRRAFLDEDFNTLLLEAIKHKNETIVKILIDHWLRNNLSIDLKISLNAAIFHGQPKMIKYIIPHCQFSKLSDQYIPRQAVIGFGPQYKECVKLLLKWNFTVSPDSNNDEDFVYAAVRKGYLPIVLQLLEFKIDVNLVNSNTGLSLLKVACLNKHHEIVESLLKHNASINVTTPTNIEKLNNLLINHYNYPSLFIYNHQDLHDITCLHIAVLNSDSIMTRLLLKYGATIIDDPQFFNITCIAIRYNCEEIVCLFLDHGLDVNYIDIQGKTLLHHCVSSLSTKQDLRYKIAKLLLERGAIIHIQSPGNTLVFDAIKNGYREIAQLFLDYNANIEYISPNGDTPLHKALENEFDVEFIKTLIKFNSPVNAVNQNKLTPLLIACKVQSVNHLEIIEVLFHYNADVNCADHRLMTPLHYACQVQNLKLVTFLLEKGANPNAVNNKGRTPLHIVYGPDSVYIPTSNESDVLSITKLLVQHNTNIEAVDTKGQTPLFVACEQIYEESVEYLLDNHANANHTDLENLTPLYVAVKSSSAGDLQAVKILLKRNVDVYCIDKFGNSVLHLIVKHETKELIKYFAYAQINFNSLNKQGNTPLHLAIENMCTVTVKNLIKYGANVNVLDKQNRTPLQMAIDYVSYHRKKLDNHYFIRKWSKSESFRGDIDGLKDIYSRLNIYPYKKIIRILKLHLVKLKTARLKVHKQNLELFHNANNYDASDDERSDTDVSDTEDSKTDIQQLELNCEQEIEKMRMEDIGVHSMTFYDLLTKNIHLLSRWVKNDKIKKTLELPVYVKKFPLYIFIIRSRFRDAKFRYRLMNSARQYFSSHINHRLPEDCIDTVFSYLNIKEIKMFIRAIKPLD